MKVGILGAGKLGLPVSVAMGYRGHEVIAYDINPAIQDYIDDPGSYPYVEAGVDGMSFAEMLDRWPPLLVDSVDRLAEADLIFVAVQTPHQPEYDGTHPLPQTRADFDYTHLKAAVESIAPHLEARHTLVVISTCLPGTMRREILPLVPPETLIYSPLFIAMGTVVPDFLNPEFVLMGTNVVNVSSDKKIHNTIKSPTLIRFYASIYNKTGDVLTSNFYRLMSYESAELAKVAYNTFIGFKIGLANTYGQLCETIPHANADDVMDTLKLATDRLISTKYLTPGMGDGGACHPRDLIAMSWLCNQRLPNQNPFDDVMNWREQHARHLARLLMTTAERYELKPALFGYAFKPDTRMTEGSHALLVKRVFEDMYGWLYKYDPMIEGNSEREHAWVLDSPRVILIGCRHHCFVDFPFPEGSVILDPHRYLPDMEGVKVIRLGE